ncbi:hypothetical protein PybrP1_006606, partial [[Pythium] brassicae (nom. inval.)]
QAGRRRGHAQAYSAFSWAATIAHLVTCCCRQCFLISDRASAARRESPASHKQNQADAHACRQYGSIALLYFFLRCKVDLVEKWFNEEVDTCTLYLLPGDKIWVKGTVYACNITTIDRQLYKRSVFERVIPPIKKSGSGRDKRSPIFVQRDNAKPHLLADDPDVWGAGYAGCSDIRVRFQPPNPPDLNLLGLGFFALTVSTVPN